MSWRNNMEENKYGVKSSFSSLSPESAVDKKIRTGEIIVEKNLNTSSYASSITVGHDKWWPSLSSEKEMKWGKKK